MQGAHTHLPGGRERERERETERQRDRGMRQRDETEREAGGLMVRLRLSECWKCAFAGINRQGIAPLLFQ